MTWTMTNQVNNNSTMTAATSSLTMKNNKASSHNQKRRTNDVLVTFIFEAKLCRGVNHFQEVAVFYIYLLVIKFKFYSIYCFGFKTFCYEISF